MWNSFSHKDVLVVWRVWQSVYTVGFLKYYVLEGKTSSLYRYVQLTLMAIHPMTYIFKFLDYKRR
jgi:hypothetical protein